MRYGYAGCLSTLIACLFSLFIRFTAFLVDRGLEPHVYYEASGVIIAFVLLGKLLEEKLNETFFGNQR
jgi:Cu2+-exporting ATPase